MQGVAIIAVALLSVTAAKEWLSNANYYQIYPRSYMDSNNDGIGDLKGIQTKVTYLRDLGMAGVWLSPIMASPMVDHGYDISDYRAINPEFGTMQDIENLIKACQDAGIHLILDFVPNHTSNLHAWFEKSENKEPGYEDYYIWHPGQPNPNGDRPLPPNNWLSIFRFSGWQWSEKRQEYYYHAFVKEQPDLNYRNPKVVEEMKEVLRFWLRKGISGFRIDAVPFLFEVEADENGDYPDEPLSGDPNCDPDNQCYLRHIYTQDRPETHDMAYQWREVVDEFSDPPRVLLVEAYTSLDNIMKYYTDGKGRKGAHIPFNFELLSNINADSSGRDIRIIIDNYLNHLPDGYEANWVLGNHDQHRMTSRLGGPEKAEVYNILLQTLPGNAVTYQGEEIVMPNVYITWKQTQDPGACATNETIFHANSRDPCRTPMQWNSGKNAGFSNASSTWLPVGPEYRTINVDVQEKAANSHLKIFKSLTTLRKRDAFQTGEFASARNVPDSVFSYIRGNDNEVYVVALNFGDSPVTLNFNRNFRGLTRTAAVEVASLNTGFTKRQSFSTTNFTLPARAGVVLSAFGTTNRVTALPEQNTSEAPEDQPSTEAYFQPPANSAKRTYLSVLLACVLAGAFLLSPRI